MLNSTRSSSRSAKVSDSVSVSVCVCLMPSWNSPFKCQPFNFSLVNNWTSLMSWACAVTSRSFCCPHPRGVSWWHSQDPEESRLEYTKYMSWESTSVKEGGRNVFLSTGLELCLFMWYIHDISRQFSVQLLIFWVFSCEEAALEVLMYVRLSVRP